MNPLAFLFAGMVAAWLLVFVYLVHVARRTARLERQLDETRRLLEERSPQEATSSSRNEVPDPS